MMDALTMATRAVEFLHSSSVVLFATLGVYALIVVVTRLGVAAAREGLRDSPLKHILEGLSNQELKQKK
jgi:hypothetical protein